MLGFIVGVVVGLAGALAVAVYVTKVPIPFMNKSQSRSAEQDAAEAKKNKDWDPNAALYGKNPVKAATPATPGQADGKAAASVAADPAKTDTKTATKETKPAVSADPLGDLVKAKGAVAEPDPFAYYVQVGAFRTMADAENQRVKLSLNGIESKISDREQSGRMVYRVRVGPFEKKEESQASKDKLDKSGWETALVTVKRVAP